MKIFFPAVLVLLVADHVIVTVEGQSKSRSEYDEYYQKFKERQRSKRKNDNNNNSGQQFFQHVKKEVLKWFGVGGGDAGDNGSGGYNSTSTGTSFPLKRFGPKHILEGLGNTILVSGSAGVFGIVSLVGLPVRGLLWSQSMFDSSSDGEYQSGSSVGKRVVGFVGGGILGGIIASTLWIGGTVYGVWQIVGGLLATPSAIWAWMEGRNYWNDTDNSWQYYNLTRHAEDLAAAAVDRLTKVQDDSLYKILGVETTATSKEIKRAYYKMALEYHPDKNPNAGEQFQKIHHAYETLYDDEKRKAYDELGISSTANLNEMFDAGIFFDVLFGLSSELENYIGDLAIKSFSSSLIQFGLTMASVQKESGTNAQEYLQDFRHQFFNKGKDRRDQRQIDVALYLQSLSKEFVEGNMSEEDFSINCHEEAIKLFESTSFPTIFVNVIGNSLYWEGTGALTSPWSVPTSLMAWTRDRWHRGQGWSLFAWNLAQAIKELKSKSLEAKEFVRKENPSSDEEKLKKLHGDKLFELMAPTLMEFVWNYNKRDIEKTLKGACWKLLHSRTYVSKQRRARQAKALRMLGQAFLNEVKRDDSCWNEEEKPSSDAMTDKTRIEIALKMATSQGKNFEDAEELIRPQKKRKEQVDDSQSQDQPLSSRGPKGKPRVKV